METQMKDTMDGLVTWSEVIKLRETSEVLAEELKAKGFEDSDIKKYIQDLVLGAFK